MKNKTIGVGKVINGRMFYVGTNGGFSKPVGKAPIETPHIEGPSEGIDLVFNFVHSRKHKKERGNIVHVDFGKEEKDSLSCFDKASNKAIKKGKDLLRPIASYFFDVDNK